VDDKAIKYRLVDYEENNIYRFLVPNKKIIWYINVYFQEKRPVVIIDSTPIFIEPERLIRKSIIRDSFFFDTEGRITK
jgi:hypothetical protein